MLPLAKFQQQFLGEILAGENPAYRVYRNNVRLTLVALLGTIYPVCKKLVGAPFFDAMAGVFIKSHTPTSGNVHEYGADFAAFIASFAPANGLPYLPDVARLEWGWHCICYHATAIEVASAYPVFDIWQSNQNDDGREIDLDAGGQSVSIYREGNDVVMKRIDTK